MSFKRPYLVFCLLASLILAFPLVSFATLSSSEDLQLHSWHNGDHVFTTQQTNYAAEEYYAADETYNSIFKHTSRGWVLHGSDHPGGDIDPYTTIYYYLHTSSGTYKMSTVIYESDLSWSSPGSSPWGNDDDLSYGGTNSSEPFLAPRNDSLESWALYGIEVFDSSIGTLYTGGKYHKYWVY